MLQTFGMLRMLQTASPRLLSPMAQSGARHVAAGAATAAAAAPGSRPVARGIVFGESGAAGWLACLWWASLPPPPDEWRRRRQCALPLLLLSGGSSTSCTTLFSRPHFQLADMDGTLTKAVIDFADMRRRVAAVGGLDSLNGALWWWLRLKLQLRRWHEG